jgi:hypothetical protein
MKFRWTVLLAGLLGLGSFAVHILQAAVQRIGESSRRAAEARPDRLKPAFDLEKVAPSGAQCPIQP